MRSIVLIAHNLRSTHNVGSLLRTAEGLGIEKVWLTGYTPYPEANTDKRLPHIAKKLASQINKTALGAEKLVDWEHAEHPKPIIAALKAKGYAVAGLEQTEQSTMLQNFTVPDKIVIIIGREVDGIETELIKQCDIILEIPMAGQKESFNVVQAAAMCLYHCRFHKT